MKQFLAKHGYSWLLTIAVGFGLWTLKMNVRATTEEQLKDYTRLDQFIAYNHYRDEDIADIKKTVHEIQNELMRRPPPPLRTPKDQP